MNFQEFKDKIEWEGGILEAIDSGLDVDRLDEVCSDVPEGFIEKYKQAQKAFFGAMEHVNALEEMLDE